MNTEKEFEINDHERECVCDRLGEERLDILGVGYICICKSVGQGGEDMMKARALCMGVLHARSRRTAVQDEINLKKTLTCCHIFNLPVEIITTAIKISA